MNSAFHSLSRCAAPVAIHLHPPPPAPPLVPLCIKHKWDRVAGSEDEMMMTNGEHIRISLTHVRITRAERRVLLSLPTKNHAPTHREHQLPIGVSSAEAVDVKEDGSRGGISTYSDAD